MKRNSVILLVAVLLLIVFMPSIFAASYKATLNPSTQNTVVGNEVTFNVNVSEIDAGENGINVLSGFIEYDKNYFESIKIEGLNSWSVEFSEENGKILATKGSFVKESEDVAKIILKVSSNATGSSTITLKDIKASNSEEEISTDSTTATVTIGTTEQGGQEQGGQDGQEQGGQGQSGQDQGGSSGNDQSQAPTFSNPQDQNTPSQQNQGSSIQIIDDNNTNNQVSNTSEKDYDYAGADNFIVPFMGFIAILGLISFVNYKRIKVD